MPDRERERHVIEGFCGRMTTLLGESCAVERWPDAESGGLGGCDAIILRSQTRWALDHTLLASFHGQQRYEFLYRTVFRPVMEKLDPICEGEHVGVVVSAESVAEGINRDSTRVQLEEALPPLISATAIGSETSPAVLDGLGWNVHISRRPSRLGGHLILGLSAPPNYENELRDGIERSLCAKSKQLLRYRNQGLKTLLLMETVDISLINEVMLAEAFSQAAAKTDHGAIDEVYLFDESSGVDCLFVWPLKFRGMISPSAWIEEFRRAQSALVFGWNDKGLPDIRNAGVRDL